MMVLSSWISQEEEYHDGLITIYKLMEHHGGFIIIDKQGEEILI